MPAEAFAGAGVEFGGDVVEVPGPWKDRSGPLGK
jgi:hypothetical protein